MQTLTGTSGTGVTLRKRGVIEAFHNSMLHYLSIHRTLTAGTSYAHGLRHSVRDCGAAV